MKINQDMTPELQLLCVVFDEPALVGFVRAKGPEALAELKEAAISVLYALPLRNRQALEYRYGFVVDKLPRTYEAIGKRMGVTRERARQIVYKGLRLLRHPTRIETLTRFTPHYDPVKEEHRRVAEEVASESLAARYELWRDRKISEALDLSPRSINVLNKALIVTVGQLCAQTERGLLRYHCFGKKSLWEVKRKLEDIGLHLGFRIIQAEPMRTVICVASIRDGSILLVRKKNVWILPGGKQKPGESDLSCLHRECGEELPRAHLSVSHDYGKFDGRTPHTGDVLRAHVFCGEIKGDITPGAEISEARYVSKEELRELLISEITWHILISLIQNRRLW